jgi:hypothetical protein
MSLAKKFIDTSPGLHFATSNNVSFAYKLSSTKALKRIEAKGFAPINVRRFGGAEAVGWVHVSHTLEDAIEAFRQDGEALHVGYDDNALFPIPEHSTERNTSDSLAWIVAILAESVSPSAELQEQSTTHFPTSRKSTMVPSPARVLPLVYFNAKSADSADVYLLLKGLQGIFETFFGHMQLGSLPPAPKKAKLVELDDCQSNKAAKRTRGITNQAPVNSSASTVQVAEREDSCRVLKTTAGV